MPLPSFRARLNEGLVLSAWSSLTDPAVHAALLQAPFDAVLFDMQHGLHDIASIASGIAVASRFGKPAIVRVPIEDRANASRALDLGASAVVMPMIETVEDAARFVSVVKYPPAGLRSFGPARALGMHGLASYEDYTSVANNETLCFAMIETRAALGNLEAIAAVEGLDGFFVGPSDLSIALSSDGRRDPGSPECREAIRHVLDVARKTGKLAGIYAGAAEEGLVYRDIGYRLVCVASDVGLLASAAGALAAAMRA